MSNLQNMQEQLAMLRERIARIDQKFASAGPKPLKPAELPSREKPEKYFIEEWASGEEVETDFGRHFEMEKLYERHKRHGSMDVGSLREIPPHMLHSISGGEVADAPPEKWAFLDTETTGLAGGSGTYAFLIGVGRITSDGFRVRQFFMREFCEETSLLHGLTEHLKQFDVLITYNGKTYDQPLLETRYRMSRMKPPFSSMAHLDLLFGARRLWKLRFESCRLVNLENQILGVERTGDLPGELIPYVYFEYLRTREAFKLIPIFHHNAVDILTLACLTGIVPQAFQSPHEMNFGHGSEMVGLARWLRQSDRNDDALQLFRRAIDRGLPEPLLFRTMWDVAVLEKKRDNEAAALALWTEIAGCKNEFRTCALEELAKYYEHRERNYAMAIEMVDSALSHEDTEELRHRRERLAKKLAKPRSRKLQLSE